MRHLILLVMLLVNAGCMTADYVGQTYARTQSVDLFFDQQDVKRPYRVMGEVTVEADDLFSAEKIQQKMIEEAKARGADAVIMGGLTKVVTGESTQWQGMQNGGRHHSYDAGTAMTQYDEKKRLTGSLLKYTN